MYIDVNRTLTELDKFNQYSINPPVAGETYLLKVSKEDRNVYLKVVPKSDMSYWERFLSIFNLSSFNLNNVLEVATDPAILKGLVSVANENIFTQAVTNLRAKVTKHYGASDGQKTPEKITKLDSLISSVQTAHLSKAKDALDQVKQEMNSFSLDMWNRSPFEGDVSYHFKGVLNNLNAIKEKLTKEEYDTCKQEVMKSAFEAADSCFEVSTEQFADKPLVLLRGFLGFFVTADMPNSVERKSQIAKFEEKYEAVRLKVFGQMLSEMREEAGKSGVYRINYDRFDEVDQKALISFIKEKNYEITFCEKWVSGDFGFMHPYGYNDKYLEIKKK